MAWKDRVKLIKKIEEIRRSRVITYITSDRGPPYNAIIADDVLPIFKQILSSIGRTEEIDLFLYSRGGNVEVPWKIVSLIREYCNKFVVLVPFRAHSAATMIALGADEIICGPAAEFGPIDPSLTTPFNPRDPKGNPLPINIEAVRAYLNANKIGLESLDRQQIFNKLSEAANPLALGEIFRQHYYIRSIAKKLLKLQQSPPSEEVCDGIVKELVEESYFHRHAITRREAAIMGLKIVNADDNLERTMWDLYLEYAKIMKLNEPLNPLGMLKSKNYENVTDECIVAFIESSDESFGFITRTLLTAKRRPIPSLSMNLNFQLPPNLLTLIQQNRQVSQVVQQLLKQLLPQIQQRVLQELNRLMPIQDVEVKVLERGWKKFE